MTGRNSSGPRSQQDPATQLSQNIPGMFQTQQQGDTQASDRHTVNPAVTTESTDASAPAPGTSVPHTSPLLCLADLQQVALDIKSTLFAAIADLKTDIRAVAARLEHVETAAMTHGMAIQQVQKVVSVHSQHLIEMHRHMEDIDSRGSQAQSVGKGHPRDSGRTPIAISGVGYL